MFAIKNSILSLYHMYNDVMFEHLVLYILIIPYVATMYVCVLFLFLYI